MRLKYLQNVCRKYSAGRDEIRVRFAPSPTGFLHLGGLRTALYNYLFAKSHNGKFILRIEDTDQARLVEGAVEQLQQDLSWAGIEVHEGPQAGGACGPYIQSQRLDKYREHVETLLNNGSAYRCFCTERRLNLLRREAVKNREVPKYDNRCRHLHPDEVQEKLSRGLQSCVRFKLKAGAESFNDLIYGSISYDITANEGDPIIIKSDGFPTYHFANVVDDHLMRVSHVLRGVEWQISTTKHILMYRAFDWEPPLYGHLPLLMNSDGTKLSKRQNDIKISHYRDAGIFPLALINFIVHSGGGFQKDSDRNVRPKSWTVEELAQQFDICRINSHSGKLMPERLSEFNRLELKRRLSLKKDENELVETVREMVKKRFSENDSLELGSEHVRNVLRWSANRISSLQDLCSGDLKFIWVSPKKYCPPDHETVILINRFIAELKAFDALNKDDVSKFLKSFSELHSVKFGQFMKTLRSILSGLKEGPSVAEMMEILGKDTTLARLKSSVNNK